MHIGVLVLLCFLSLSSTQDSTQPGPSSPGVASEPAAASPPVHNVNEGSGLSGTRTEHRGSDGSLITVTNFRGNLPYSAIQPSFYPSPYGLFQSYPFFGYPPASQQQPAPAQ